MDSKKLDYYNKLAAKFDRYGDFEDFVAFYNARNEGGGLPKLPLPKCPPKSMRDHLAAVDFR